MKTESRGNRIASLHLGSGRLNTFSTNADFLRYKNIYMLFKIDFEGSLRKYLVNYKELVGEKSPNSEVLLKDERGK